MQPDSSSDTLDPARLLAAGVAARVEHYDSLSSTHDRAHEVARSAAAGPLPLLIVAEEQTAGRGRGSNRWWTGRGSLAFSLLFDPANWVLSPQPMPERSLAIGAAIVETVASLVPPHKVGLHWPNDVYVEGRKLAGILVDVLPAGRHVLGIGINVNNSLAGAPDDVRARATSLCELAGHTFDRNELLVTLLLNIENAVRDSAADPLEFGRRFQDLCLQVGRELTVEVGSRQYQGTCAGIGPDGALLLEGDDGFRKIYSGVLRHA
jgi:BirA family transcriptional regulator, biotin operon repressor / biotin---[acetyl-CoA-carboxylase] ligase